jgi:hypothetical protein
LGDISEFDKAQMLNNPEYFKPGLHKDPALRKKMRGVRKQVEWGLMSDFPKELDKLFFTCVRPDPRLLP